MDTRKCYNLKADIIELIEDISEEEYTLEWLIGPDYDADSDADREYRAGDIENTIAIGTHELRSKVQKFNQICLMDGTPPYTVKDRACCKCKAIVAKCDLEDRMCPDCYDEMWVVIWWRRSPFGLATRF